MVEYALGFIAGMILYDRLSRLFLFVFTDRKLTEIKNK